MAGNKSGGRQAAITNKARHGDDFYVRIGAKGGTKSRGGGFQAGSEWTRAAGRKGGAIGGKISKRGPVKSAPYAIIDAEEADKWTFLDPGIDNHIIEPSRGRKWHQGWFKKRGMK